MKKLIEEMLKTMGMPSEKEKLHNRRLARQALRLLRRLMSVPETNGEKRDE